MPDIVASSKCVVDDADIKGDAGSRESSLDSLKQVLGPAKKPVENLNPENLGRIPNPRLRTIDMVAATMDRLQIKFSAESDVIREAVNTLLREGVPS